MTCARREAGAHRPAAPTPAGSARPDPRSGRRRARLSFFLPVLALLLGALGLFAAAPAQAQTTVWSATLTVQAASNFGGCISSTCPTRLTQDKFTHGGIEYTINDITLYFGGDISFTTNKNGAFTALSALTLTVGSGPTAKTFRGSDATSILSGRGLQWSNSQDLSWSSGDTVSLSLTAPAAKPAKPTGLTATAGNAKVDLSWTDPSDSSITKYQVRQKEGSNRWGSWTDIPSSSATTTSYAVTGLKNGTAYRFRIRAVNAAGEGPQSAVAEATPAATTTTPSGAVWSATLTVQVSSQSVGCSGACSTRLTNNKFTHGGIEYTIEHITLVSGGRFSIWTNKNGAYTALSGLTLTVGSGMTAKTFRVSDATANVGGASFYWTNSQGLSWSANDMVALSLAATATNSAATGKPSITGTATVGQTLTAAKGTIADTNGVTKADNGDAGFAYTYQWIRVDSDGSSNAADISGAMSSTYVLKAADQGKKVKVKLSFKDDAGNAESRTSDAYPASGTVAAAATTPTPSGGIWSATLTVDHASIFAGCGTSEGLDDCATTTVLSEDQFTHGEPEQTFTITSLHRSNSGTGGLYFQFNGLTGAQAKTALSALTLTVTKGGTSTTLKVSEATTSGNELEWASFSGARWGDGDTVSLQLNAPATNSTATGKPSITGTATVGQTLTAAKGTIADTNGVTKADNGDAGFAYAYQWIRVDSDGSSNAADISGATSSTYTLAAADQGKKVKVKLSFQDDAGNAESRTSDAYPASGTVAAAATGPAVTAIAVASSPPSSGWYNLGKTIAVEVTFDEVLAVTGSPELKIRVGSGSGSEKTATCARKGSSGDARKALTCSYTVASGDEDTDGISVERNKLSLPSGAAIKDGSNNDATLTYAASLALGAQSGHKVDAKPPALTIGTPTPSGPAQSKSISVTLTDSGSGVHTALNAYWIVDATTASTTCDLDSYQAATITETRAAYRDKDFTSGTPVTLSSETNNGQYVCFAAVDSASNARYARSAQITGIDTTDPGIAWPTSWAPKTGVAGTIVLTDSNAKIAKYGAIPVVGTSTDATACDTAAEIGTANLTTLTTPSASVNFEYTPPADSATKKVCAYAEDAAGNSHALLYGTAIAAGDTTAPTVTVGSTGYYSDAGATTALTGAQKAGADIYTKVTFSEDMKHVKSDAAAARPELSYRIGSTDTQYHILDSGDTLASGDCKPEDSTSTDVYICRYTVGSSDSGAFTVKAGTNSADEAGNALGAAYTHAATLALDNTAPTVTAAETGFYSDAALSNALSGTVKLGAAIYAKVTFSEDMKHAKSETDGLPEISVVLSGTTAQRLHIVDSGDTPAALDCKPNHATRTNVYACFVATVSTRDIEGTGVGLRVGTDSVDKAGNALASVYDHASSLTIDNRGPSVEFPSGAPTVGTVAAITLADATSKVAKYGIVEVDGAATNAEGCDDPSASGDDFSTTAVSPAVSPKEVSHTPVTAGKKICVYAEDGVGNSHAELWSTAIAAAADNTAPTVTSAETGYYSDAGATTALTGPLKSGADIYTKVTFSEDMKHVKSDAAAARPELSYRIGSTDTQYHILDSGDTLASGDCKPEDSTSTDVYICFYTVGSSDSGAFTVKAGTNSVDEAGNALATAYTHAATLALDNTAPTVTAAETGYYGDAGATTALTGPLKSGADIYTKVTFSENMKHVKGDGSSARPAIAYSVGTGVTGVVDEYDMLNNGDTLASGDCKPNHATNTNVYICLYTVESSDNGAFRLEVDALESSTDLAGNDLPDYMHAATLTLDTTAPSAPVSLAAEAGDAKVTLTWSDPSPADATISKWQYRQKDSGSYGEWQDVTGGASARSVEVGSLSNGTAYTFQVRAVDTAANEGAAGTTDEVTPAAATTTPTPSGGIWSATLTVDHASLYAGCGTDGGLDDCATTTVLSEDQFTHGEPEQTFTITNLYRSSSVTGTGPLSFRFSGLTGAAAKTALSALTLKVTKGGTSTTLKVSEATTSGNYLKWASFSGASWGDGDTVSLQLNAPAAAKPAKPTGLTATAGDKQVALSWTDPSDSSITKYQYRQKAGSAAWGSWTDIPSSSATTTSYTVTGLANGTAYRFRIRAVNAAGEGPQSAVAGPATPAASDTTAPTVTVGSTGYYSDAAAATALTGPLKSGADIYTKVTFSEDMKHVKSDAAAARPELFRRIGSTDTRYHILDSGDTLASGDCKPEDSTSTDVYICFYTVGSSDSGAFTVKAGTNSVDEAGNALATAYTHAATLALDTTAPGIAWPTSWAPKTGVSGTIVLTDSNAKIAKYGAIPVVGTSTDATGCDTAAEIGTGNLTTLGTPSASVDFEYTPPADSATKKVCAYAEDAAGNSHALLYGTAIAQSAPAQPTGLKATAGDAQVDLAWTDPSDSTITKYQVAYKKKSASGSASFADIAGSGATTTSHTVTGLDNGDVYQFWLRAVNSGGNGTHAGPVEATPASSDTTAPTVTSAETGYYSEAGATTALTGPLKSGADIYTKVTFSEDMKHVKSDAAAARPELSYRIGTTDTQYHILDSGDTLASGDCKPEDSTSTDVYICFYTVGSSDSGAFTVKAGTNSVDEAGNALGAVYTHAATLTLDTTAPAAPSALALASGTMSPGTDATPSIEVTVGETGGAVTLYSDAACTTTASVAVDVTDATSPYTVTVDATALTSDGSVTFYVTHADAAGNASACSTANVAYVHDGTDPEIAFPDGVTPTAGTAAKITLTDATSKVAKYGIVEVDGAATNADACDDPSASGDNFSTTAVSPAASPKEVSHTPATAGKKVCVYAEDAAGNSHAELWSTAIAAAATTPTPSGAVWSATLTVDQASNRAGTSTSYGCDNASNPSHDMENCSKTTVLTDDDFDYPTGGTTYTIDRLNHNSDGSVLSLGFSGVTAAAAKTALTGLTLTVGTGTTAKTFAIADATAPSTSGSALTWSSAGLSWSSGDTVALSLTGPAPATPAKPADLTATAGDKQVALSWTDPSDSGITGYQVQRKAGTAAWGSWTDIPSSAPGETNATSYTVTGLANGTAYRFRIRAVNAGGEGPQSAVAGPVTPAAATTTPTAVWSAMLTVGHASGVAGCGYPGLPGCATRSVLSKNSFTHGGKTYTFTSLYRYAVGDAGAGRLNLEFSGLTAAQVKAALSGLTLTVTGGGTDTVLKISEATTSGDELRWNAFSGARWGDGDTVTLSLTGTATTPAVPPSGPNKLVGNVLQAAGPITVPFKWDAAQSFTTGRHPGGYRLTHVDIAIRDGSPSAPEYKVTIHAPRSTDPNSRKGGLPGAKLATLTKPEEGLPTDDGKVARFTASGGIELAPRSRYFVVIDVTGPGDRRVKMRTVAAVGGRYVYSAATAPKAPLDGDSVANWSIGKVAWRRAAGSGGSWTKKIPRPRLQMAVYGTAKAAPQPVPAMVPEGAIWSSSLTVGRLSNFRPWYGCGNWHERFDKCPVALSDDDFAHGGAAYKFHGVGWYAKSFEEKLELILRGPSGEAARAALGSLTLHVDGKAFALGDARVDFTDGFVWFSWPWEGRWDEEQLVSLALTDSGTPSGAPAAVPPALEWARVNGAELALRFDKGLDESSAPSASAFSVEVAGAARAVSSVSVSAELVTLTLASAVTSGEAVTVGYAPPAEGPALRLSGGGAAVAAFSGQAAANDTPARQVQSGLTASVASAPAEHRGEGQFEVRIAFSEAVAGRAKDAGVEVSGGTLARAVRVNKRKDLWALTVNPSGYEAVTVTLPATADCAAAGAVCTADGRRLETALTHTVPGPVTVSVADARAKEGEDAAMDFAVTLSRAASGEVTVTYATRDGTAKKGKDYRQAKGTLGFAAGETAKTVSVALLDDAKDEGEETFRLVLKKAVGAVIADGEATGTIENDDPMPAAWLARFGRTVAGQAVDAVTERLSGGGASHVTLGGQQVSLDSAQGRAEAAADIEAVAAALGAGPEDRWPRDPWTRGREADDGAGPSSRTMTGRELLLGSAFHLQSGGEVGGPAFAAWGRVATGGFDGEEDGVTMDGTVTTGFLGADVSSGRWLAGAAVAVSEGEGSFALSGATAAESAFEEGEVESSLTSVLPYARLEVHERLTAWAMAGYGTGELTLTEKGETVSERHEADLTLTLGALGGRGTLVDAPEGGGFALALRGDAFWVRTESEATQGMAGATADVTRLRLVLDASRPFAAGGGTLTPSLEAGVRLDGGDAETGAGVELGAGLAWADPASGVSAELRGRWLAAHESSGYEEWGASGSVRVDPGASGRGLSLTLTPVVGAAGSGTGNLWSAADARGIAPGGEFEAAQRLDAELGYGLSGPLRLGTATPYAGLGLADGGARAWRAGVRWRVAPEVSLDLEGTRTESANDNAPEQGLMLRGAVRW